MSIKALEAKNIFKNFDQLQVLQNISFSLEIGQCQGVIGPNGAGKTTLFNLISGTLSPSSGQIFIFGQNVTNMPSYSRARLGLSRTFQVTNLFFGLSVIDNVLLGFQAAKCSPFNMFRPFIAYHDLWGKARDLLEPWGLWGKKDIPVKELPYGEQRQIELILSLSSKPKLLLLDEPSCGMTPFEVGNITKIIKAFRKEFSTIIISHDMDFVFNLDLDFITVLNNGKMVAEGSQNIIRTDPKVKEIYLGREEDVAGTN